MEQEEPCSLPEVDSQQPGWLKFLKWGPETMSEEGKIQSGSAVVRVLSAD